MLKLAKLGMCMLAFLLLLAACGTSNSEQANGTEQVDKEPNPTEFAPSTDAELEQAREEVRKQAEMIGQSGVAEGSKPPSLALETLSGEVFDESILEGKKVIINFFASWCGPCRMEMPDIVKFYEGNKEDVLVLAINVQEQETTVQKFVDEFQMKEIHVLLDRTGELAEQFQVIALPSTFFLNSEGVISNKHIGYMTYAQLEHYYQNMD